MDGILPSNLQATMEVKADTSFAQVITCAAKNFKLYAAMVFDVDIESCGSQAKIVSYTTDTDRNRFFIVGCAYIIHNNIICLC